MILLSVLANFAIAVPLSRDHLAREVRQYQYYPDYNYQYIPDYNYQYDGQNGQYDQIQQEIYDICDDRAFQDMNLMQMLKHFTNQGSGNIRNGQPPNGQPPNGQPPNGQPSNGRPPNGQPPNGGLQNGRPYRPPYGPPPNRPRNS